ncbi:hypothetical protein [Tamaricihabitans halophyticus]|uniref:hypothetical protein n=1 Tax=Tamaricihabitans halophyticus TaxID=1262583 RepID=UPI00105362F0|nr:hypothetical protein [Tamaricihabitans halophyticus]
MSAGDLMQQAQEIENEAIKAAQLEMAQATGGRSATYTYEMVEQQYRGTIGPHFEAFSRMPDPSSYDGPIEDLTAAMTQLSPGDMQDPVSDKPIRANRNLERIGSAGGCSSRLDRSSCRCIQTQLPRPISGRRHQSISHSCNHERRPRSRP